MYTIGEFSAITGISKKTLRYYDEISLLKPASINEENNYRQYANKQILSAEFISSLKKFGLSLNEIKELVKDDSNSKIDDILSNRLERIKEEIRLLNEQVNYIMLYRKNTDTAVSKDFEFAISKTIFSGGNILSMTIGADEIHSQIHEFYDYAAASECVIVGSHYFRNKISLSDDENTTEIFAFVKNSEVNKPISIIDNAEAFRVKCNLKSRGKAYEKLIGYAKEVNIVLGEFIEEYQMHNGKMELCIYGILKN